MNRINKIAIGCISMLVAGALSFPWLLYAIGLANIDGRPSLPHSTALDADAAQKLWKELKEDGPIRVEKLSPWHYVAFMLDGNNKPKSGEYLAWFIARKYNSTHLQNKRMIYWHLSGAALTIWLTRHWSADQLLSKAKEINETGTI